MPCNCTVNPTPTPQVDDWTPDLVEIEARHKQSADYLLFVIDAQTRAIASIVEATEYCVVGREVILCIVDVPPGTEIDGAVVGEREMKDLNRARQYLRDVAHRHGILVHDEVPHALHDLRMRLQVFEHICMDPAAEELVAT